MQKNTFKGEKLFLLPAVKNFGVVLKSSVSILREQQRCGNIKCHSSLQGEKEDKNCIDL
jgi:hypothetical protein